MANAPAHLHHGHAPHTHSAQSYNRAFLIGMGLNLSFVAVEVGYGYFTNSIALIADGTHNLSDVAGMALAFAAFRLMQKQPNHRFTFGYGRATILAAFFNALILFGAVGALGLAAIQRLQAPAPVPGGIVAAVAGFGIVINTITALLFLKDKDKDLNMRGTYLHMVADAAVSAGVLVSGLVIIQTGWYWLDPVMSLTILGVIVWGTWGLMRESANQLLDGVPSNLQLADIHAYLSSQEGVLSVHDLHVWNLTTNQTALTAHLLLEDNWDSNSLLDTLTEGLLARFSIEQTTLQVERGVALDACA